MWFAFLGVMSLKNAVFQVLGLKAGHDGWYNASTRSQHCHTASILFTFTSKNQESGIQLDALSSAAEWKPDQ